MSKEPPNPNPDPQPGKSLPPPDIPKAPAPPEPPASSEPPLKVSVDPSSSADDAEEHVVTGEDVPGADASMANRIIATAIDAIVAFGLNVGASIVLSRIPGPAEHLSALVGVAYLLTRDALPFLEGQSVGKKAMGIRAVTTAGKPLTGDWQPCLIRNGVLIIPFFALVELIVLLTRQDKPKPLLRLGDEWAHTKVINEGPAQ